MTRIAVIGAGPGGGSAALALARAGCEVTLYRPGQPGEKPCGGALPAYLLEELPAGVIEGLESVRAPWAVLENADESACELPLGELRIYCRRDFDGAIEAAAVAAGAELIDHKVSEVRPGGNGVEIAAGATRRSYEWIIAADGARSRARRAAGVAAAPESLGLGATLEGVEAERLVLSFPDRGDAYAWIFPRPGGVSVGVAYSASRLSHGAAKALLRRFLARHLPEAIEAPGSHYRYPIPVFSSRTVDAVHQAAKHRILLVGDAAGLADPVTREGIRPAIRSGLWSAERLLEGRPGEYADRLAAELAGEMRRARRAAKLFYDDPIGQWMVPVSRVHPGIRTVLVDLMSCRQPYTGLRRRLLRAAFGAG